MRRPTVLYPMPGTTPYGLGRAVAAVAQLAFAAALTRRLPAADVGRFAAAFAAASVCGVYFASSTRRLTLYRPEGADLSDVKAVAVAGNLCGAFGAGVICAATFDPRTALIATLLAGLRGADGYAEVGQAIWCRQGRFRRAGSVLALRTAGSTLAGIAFLPAGGIVPALLASLFLRSAIAAVETHVALPQRFRPPSLRSFAVTFGRGSWVALAAAAVLLVDALPTLTLTKVIGLADAALLTPLGRLRFAIVFVATTFIEVCYPEMARRANAGRRVAETYTKPLLQLTVLVAVLMPLASLGGAELAFGHRMAGHGSLVALAILSGGTMGICNLVSAGMTAEARIVEQVATYVAAGIVAMAISWAGGWSVAGMYLGQSAGCLLAFVAFIALTRHRDLFRGSPSDELSLEGAG